MNKNYPEIIGSGAYSGVLKDPRNKIAIKYFKEKNSRPAIKEIALLKYLEHPGILRYDDANYISGDKIWKIYTAAYSTDLFRRDWLYSGKTDLHPIEYLSEMIFNILSAIKYLHDVRVIHADIKPANILHNLHNRKTVLCDFNCSIFCPAKYNTSYIQTDGYRAPEVCLRKPESKYGYGVDVWSIGCVMYELLTNSSLIDPSDLTDDTTTGLMDFYGIACEPIRKIRLLKLKRYNYSDMLQIIAEKIRKSNWMKHLRAETNDVSAVFVKHYIAVLSGSLIVNQKNRWNSGKLLEYWHKNISFGIFGFNRAFSPTKPELPTCISANSDKIISDSLDKLSEQINIRTTSDKCRNIAGKIYELMLFCSLDKHLCACARTIEINYYKKTETFKIDSSRESMLIYCAALYISSAIMYKHPPQMIFEYFPEKKIYDKCVSMMKILDNKLIC